MYLLPQDVWTWSRSPIISGVAIRELMVWSLACSGAACPQNQLRQGQPGLRHLRVVKLLRMPSQGLGALAFQALWLEITTITTEADESQASEN